MYCVSGILLSLIFFTEALEQANPCGGLPDPQNGVVIIDENGATYRCNRTYVTIGSKFRICNTDGNWSGNPPKCEKRCIKPELENKTGIIGARIIFFCRRVSTNVTLLWYLNGKLYNNDTLNNITYSVYSTSSVLRIPFATEDLNNTEVMCSVIHSEGNECNSSISTLLLQGLLSEVSNVCITWKSGCSTNGSLHINWTPPYSLDLPNIEVDIRYKLEIGYNSQSILNQTMISKSNIMEIIPDIYQNNISCYFFNVTITPYNLVGCGKSTTVVDYPLNKESVTVEVIQSQYINGTILFTLKTRPSICGVDIELRDTRRHKTVSYNNVQIMGNCSDESFFHISELNSTIMRNTHYLAMYHLRHNGFIPRNIIRTFDIQNCRIYNNSWNNEVVLTVDFIKNSAAKGALLLFIGKNLGPPVFHVLNRNDSEEFAFPYNILQTKLFVYDIEEDGLLNSGVNYPAITLKNVNQINLGDLQSSNCTINSKEHDIFILCYCPCCNNYQALLFRSGDQNGTLISNSSNCSTSIMITAEESGEHYIAIIMVNKEEKTQFELIHLEYVNVSIELKEFTENEASENTDENVFNPTNIDDHNTKKDIPIGVVIGVVIGGLVMLFIIIAIIAIIVTVIHLKKKVPEGSLPMNAHTNGNTNEQSIPMNAHTNGNTNDSTDSRAAESNT